MDTGFDPIAAIVSLLLGCLFLYIWFLPEDEDNDSDY